MDGFAISVNRAALLDDRTKSSISRNIFNRTLLKRVFDVAYFVVDVV